MRKEYDFSQSVPNPYTKNLKKQITIRLEEEVVDYFKTLSGETGGHHSRIAIPAIGH